MATLRYDVDVDTKRAEARIGAFALRMRKQISDAIKSLPEIELDANSTKAQVEIARIRRELKELSSKRIGIDIDAKAAEAELKRLGGQLRELSGKSGSIQVDADVASALAALKLVDKEVDKLDGRKATVKVDVDRSLGDSIIQVTRLAGALKALTLPAAALAVVPQLASIGNALIDVSGAAGLVPAAVAVAGGAIATLAVGFAHVTDALGPAGTPAQLKKVTEALALLSPNARTAVEAVRGFAGAWTDLRLDVQQKLFAGMSAEVKDLGKVALPQLRTGLGGIAEELNLSARGLLDWAKRGSTIRDVGVLFFGVKQTLHELVPAGANVAQAFLDIGVVGMKFLPGLAAEAEKLTERFRNFIGEARESGKLQEWISTGIDKLAELGKIVLNVGSALGAFFKAGAVSGADFLGTLQKVTGEVAKFLNSAEGQNALVAIFRTIRDVVDALLPAVIAVGKEIAEGIGTLAPKIKPLAEAFADTLKAAAPMVGVLAELASAVLPPITAALAVIGPFLAPIVVGFAAFALASKGILAVAQSLVAVKTALMGISAANVVLGAVTLAAVGLAVLFDQLRDKSGELAQKIVDGSITMHQAIAEETAQIERRNLAMDAATTAANEGIVSSRESASASEVNAEATAKVTEEHKKLLAAMDPLTRAQTQVREAQTAFNEAVAAFGAGSPAAQAAAGELATANQHLKDITQQTADATKTLGDRIVETSQHGAAAANSQVGYKQSLLDLADATKRAAAATREHGASSDEATRANLAVEQASLRAAAAAQKLAEDNARASGSTNVAEIGAQAYKEELLRQASTMTGPLKQALIDQANGLDTAKRATSTAEIQSRLYKDQLGLLAGQTSGPLAAALRGAMQNFDTLGGAHATAQQRAEAQKAELLRLAAMASGPLRASLLAMAAQINTLPDGSFTITGTGVINPLQISSGTGRGASTFGLAEGGVIGQMADGGVMPGYTPGRDVHRFVSATGGILDLAGGEPVMRPEFGRAVGHQWIHAANKAARTGGVAGVTSFISRTAPRGPGVEGRQGDGSAFARGGVVPHQRLAFGGYVAAGTQPFPRVATESYIAARNKLVAMEAEKIKAQIKKWLEAGGNGLAFARTQVGKPYIWGASGPGGYDCSGFMSAIVNVMRGRYPYSRVGSTGTFPWAGFSPGLGAGLNIGAFRGNPGHMAGTIAGVNVESAGSVGVRVGGPVGATSGMFNIRAHLADKGGLLPSGHAAVNLSGRDEYVVAPQTAQTMGSTYNVSVIFQNAINAMDDSLMRQAAIKVADAIKQVERSRS